jgi:hypothetical protein
MNGLIEKILKRRKRSGRDEFLVQWKGTEETSWVKRQDLTPAALFSNSMLITKGGDDINASSNKERNRDGLSTAFKMGWKIL